jgi:hypothetical protein
MIRVYLMAALVACARANPKPVPAPPLAPPSADAADAVAPALDAGSAADDLSAECRAYVVALDKVQACPNLPPDKKDAMVKGVNQIKAQLHQLWTSSPQQHDQMNQACKIGADAYSGIATSLGC